MNEIRLRGNRVELNITLESKKLAEYLGDCDVDDRVEKFGELVEAALAARSAFLVDLETQTLKRSVDDAIDSMEKYWVAFKQNLEEQLDALADPEEGTFAQTFRDLVAGTFEDLLDPFRESDKAPIARLRQHSDLLDKQVREYIEPIRQKLGVGETKKDQGAGDNFESIVSTVFEKLAVNFNDTPSRIGSKTVSGSTSKKGDLKIEIAAGVLGAPRSSIVVEMKTDKSYKMLGRKTTPNLAHDENIKSAMQQMMEDTMADAAIFVLDDADLDMEHQVRWKALGERQLLVVVDRFAPDRDYVQLAYAWARWQATRNKATEKEVFDVSAFEESLKSALESLKQVTTIQTTLTRGMGAIESAKTSLGAMRDNVHDHINSILLELPQSDE